MVMTKICKANLAERSDQQAAGSACRSASRSRQRKADRSSSRFSQKIVRSELALDYEVIERPVEDRIYSAKQNQSFYEGLHSCKA